jgi:hypothetical protein
MRSRRLRRGGEGHRGCLIAVVILVGILLALIFFKPEVFRTRAQVPVSVTVRPSLIGIGNVVQVRNNSAKALTEVVVTGRNPANNQTATHHVGHLGARELAEVGWMEWNWTVTPGETITISARGYLPIVFSSDQLGIR